MQAATSFFLLALLAINIIIIYQLRNTRRTEVLKHLGFTVLGMACITIPEIIMLITKERQVAYYAFTFYFIAFAWYTMMLFRFSVIYSGYRLFKIYKSPLFWITIIESAVFIGCMSSERLFVITHAKWLNHIFWVYRCFPLLYAYFAVNAVVLAASVIVLIIAAQKSAKIYRLKFSSIVVLITIMLVFNFIPLFKQQPILLQAICFSLCEMVILYMAVYYAPKKLNNRALRFVADKLNDGIVLYDEEHQLQLITSGYSDAVGLKGMEGIENEEKYWENVMAGAKVENAWGGHVKCVLKDQTECYYEIHNKVLDEGGKLIGTVYWIRNVTESIVNGRKMMRRANYDELTGIYNEAHFHEEARKVLEGNPDTEFIMTCSSVKKIKVFRELFGKEKYEEFLTRTAELLKKGFANHPTCKYGRVGEADFYVLMPKGKFDPQYFFERIDKLTAPYNTNNFSLEVKTGVYEIAEHTYNMLAICNKASIACDAIKRDYQKRILWYDEKVQKESQERERYNAELSNAIENGEMQIYLQPQMDGDGRILGAEALARWIHKEEGLISPAKFIPYFEMNGRITELDICIWKQACEKLKEWKEKGREDLHISVNISAKDLYVLDIYEYYVNLVKQYGISPEKLKLEITESAIVNDLEQHVNLVERLQEAGFEVEMDDFGSAYSSFNMLKDVCVDVIKMDMKFLGNTENKDRSHAILKSIVDLSKVLNMKTVAEGVETKEQLEFLKGVGCDIYQGYYFSKPMSVADFEAKYLQ